MFVHKPKFCSAVQIIGATDLNEKYGCSGLSGRGRFWGERDRFPYLAFPAPAPFFLASSILPLFDCKILSIVDWFSPFSAAIPTLIELPPPALSSLATHPFVRQLTRASN